MSRTQARPPATSQVPLHTSARQCPGCGQNMYSAYTNDRKVITLAGLQRLCLHIRRCGNPACNHYHRPYRPEEEGRFALPQHEFGLDVIALVGALRYQQHRSVPEIHQDLRARGVGICERNVTNLLDRYDELICLRLADSHRLRRILRKQGRVILALDGLQPDVGHEVLWVLRDCLSGEVLLARSLLSSTEPDVARLIQEVKDALPVAIVAVVSDGQRSIRKAVAKALPDLPHQLCHFHYLREAAKPVYEADRHAKKELKKRVRGIRPIERRVENRTDPSAQAVQGYCSAVRSALTDDGRPPLQASGLKLHERLSAISTSLQRVKKKGGLSANSRNSNPSWIRVWPKPSACGRPFAAALAWCIGRPRSWTIRMSNRPPSCVVGTGTCCDGWRTRPGTAGR
jgi:hypothetical protein